MRQAFSIDLDRCIGCRACVLACSTGNETPPGAYVRIGEVVRRHPGGLWGSFTHHRCFHCGEAACVSVCPTGALFKRNGLTAVAAERCSGCGYCVDACPYQVPRLEDARVSKCVGCLEQALQGRPSWCEATCPSGAIRFGPREQVLDEARARAAALRPRHPQAQVYGETQAGGLGLVLVLLDRPEQYGLPASPERSPALEAWRKAVRPAAVGLSSVAAVSLGVMFLVARRKYLQERDEADGSEGE